MLELVNTSLPNGLIAGTHGYATVALTKGCPDALRTRLEAFCGYSHKSSAHDGTYLTQNPVNWFHAILSQDNHVLGRVAASDFDYTGRTNRLARMIVLAAREMPRCGAAKVLETESGRLSAPWSGDPRWLEGDTETPRRLASIPVPVFANPANWESRFGKDGATLARRVAWALEKAIKGGGKPIYFKTSAAFDRDGTILLGLFEDVIALLPPVLRASATFSTYPDALPGGTVCHLRGAFDGDRGFAAASASQPWVDCEKGCVVNAGLLPAEDERNPSWQSAAPRNNAPVASGNGGAATHAAAQGQRVPVSQNKFDPSRYAQPRGGGDKKMVAVLGVACVAVIAMIAASALILTKGMGKRPPVTEGLSGTGVETQTEEVEIKPIDIAEDELDKREMERKREEEIKRASQSHAPASGTQTEQPGGETGNAAHHAPLAATPGPSTKAQPSNPEDNRPDFVHAERLEVVEIGKFSDEDFIKGHNPLRAFYYDDDGCKNIASKAIDGKEKKVAGNTKWLYTPAIDDLRESCKGRFIIFYDETSKKAFWLWKFVTKEEDYKQWFVNGAEKNLKQEVFGEAEAVGKFFKDMAGDPKFTIERKGDDNLGVAFEKEISDETVDYRCFTPPNKALEDEKSIDKEITKKENEIQVRKGFIETAKGKCSDIRNKCKKLKETFKAIQKAKEDKSKAKNNDEIVKAVKSESDENEKRRTLINDITRLFGEIDIKVLNDFAVNDAEGVDGALTKYNEQLDKLEKAKPEEDKQIKDLNAEIKKLKEAKSQLDAKFEEEWRKVVKDSKYGVTGVRGSKEGK